MTATPSHIVLVSLENEDYSTIVGNTADAPFLNQPHLRGDAIYEL
jgi:hypothetical protein